MPTENRWKPSQTHISKAPLGSRLRRTDGALEEAPGDLGGFEWVLPFRLSTSRESRPRSRGRRCIPFFGYLTGFSARFFLNEGPTAQQSYNPLPSSLRSRECPALNIHDPSDPACEV